MDKIFPLIIINSINWYIWKDKIRAINREYKDEIKLFPSFDFDVIYEYGIFFEKNNFHYNHRKLTTMSIAASKYGNPLNGVIDIYNRKHFKYIGPYPHYWYMSNECSKGKIPKNYFYTNGKDNYL